MTSPLKVPRLTALLYVNAAVLILILITLLSRNIGSTAMAQDAPKSPQPETPIHGLTVMPGQLSPQVWGCYVIDNVNQTLSVYSYSPGEHQLRLAAARDVQYDRKLGDYNTSPSPSEVKTMVELAQQPQRGVPAVPTAPER